MRCFVIIIALAITAFPLSGKAAAVETRYVSDQLVITLRQGKGTGYKILKTLKTGAPVEVLGDSGSYLKVRTADGMEGYVLSQYIMSDPPKALLVDELNRENSELKNTKNNLQTRLEEVQAKYGREFSELNKKAAAVSQDLQQTQEREATITEKYNTLAAESENIIQTTKERDQLRKANTKLQAEVKELRAENKKKSDSRMIKWFLAGGGVFLFGWLIGKISRKKRSRF